MAEAFPGEHDLCENCGYPLRGIAAEAACPECGQPVEASHPQRRPGLPWQQRRSVATLFHTADMVLRRPRGAFRAMTTTGSRIPARLFLVVMATLASLTWAAIAAATTRPNVLGLAGGAILVGHATLVLTYVEAMGVSWIGKRRGWRTPLRVTEAVACYAATGWVPAVIAARVMIWAVAAYRRTHWLNPLYDPAVAVIVAAVAMLAFEGLVYVGVRQVRYANG